MDIARMVWTLFFKKAATTVIDSSKKRRRLYYQDSKNTAAIRCYGYIRAKFRYYI
jgi:hypothetical protein